MIPPQTGRKSEEPPFSVIKPGEAPYYLAHIRNKLIERYGPEVIEQGGLEVTTAMDLPLQRLAEKVLSEGVRRISPELQGALICLDPIYRRCPGRRGGSGF